MEIQIKNSERAFFGGKTGCGKTNVMLHLRRTFPITLVFDLKRSPAFDKLKDTEYINQYSQFNETRANIVYRPAKFDNAWLEKDIDKLCDRLLNSGNRVIFIDEIFFGSSSTPDIPSGFKKLIQMGRERGLGVIVGTQKMTYLRPEYFDQTEHIFIFKMVTEEDKRKAVKIMRADSEKHHEKIMSAFPKLQKYEFLYQNEQRISDEMLPVTSKVEKYMDN